MGKLPSDAELSTLIERYAGTSRVTCEVADEFFASVGEVVPARPQLDPELVAREVEEVAGGSWLEKIGSGSSAPPRVRDVASEAPTDAPASGARPRRSSIPPVLSITPVPQGPEPAVSAVSVQQGLEQLPAATYSTMPPPSALPSHDSVPIALPLSSRPPLASLPPIAAESDSVLLEQWGPAASTTLTPSPFEAAASASEQAAPTSGAPSPFERAPSRVPPLPASASRVVAEGPASFAERSASVPPLPDARSSSRVPPLPRSAAPEGATSLDARSSSVPPLPRSAAPEGAMSLDARSSSVPPLPRSAAPEGSTRLASVPALPRSAAPEGLASLDARSSSVPALPPSVGPEASRSSSVAPLPRSAAPNRNAGLEEGSSPVSSSAVPAAVPRTAEEALLSAEEDALLDQWSDDLDNALPSAAGAPATHPPRAASRTDAAVAADEPEPWNDDLGSGRAAAISSRPERASHAGSDAPRAQLSQAGRDDDAPLSTAELSLLDRWSPSDEPATPSTSQPESAITGGFEAADYAAAVYAPSDSRFPRARNRSQQPRSLEQPDASRTASAMPDATLGLSARPPAFPSHRPAAPVIPSPRPPIPAAALAASLRPPPVAAKSGEPEDAELLDVEEIELDPDDLIEVDNE